MRLSHIHEDRSLSLADWLNEKRLCPARPDRSEGPRGSITTALYSYKRGSLDEPWLHAPGTAGHESELPNEFIKDFRAVKIEYEEEQMPENHFDDTEDEYSYNPAPITVVVEGNGEFAGQFAWYNEDLYSYRQILPQPRPSGLGSCWQDGKPPILSAEWRGRW